MDQENSENVQADQQSVPVNTGDGSRPAGAGSQDQDQTAADQAAANQVAAYQAASQDQASNNNVVEEFKQSLEIMLRGAFDTGREHFDTICDQHSETIGALAKLTEVIKSEMGTQSNMITNFFTALAEQQTQICNLLKNLSETVIQNLAINDSLADLITMLERIEAGIKKLQAE